MCDYCGDWYHYDCIGIDHVIAKGIDTYKCQVCISKGMDELMYEEGEFEIGNVYIHTNFIIEHPQKRALELAFGEQQVCDKFIFERILLQYKQKRKDFPSFIASPAYWTE